MTNLLSLCTLITSSSWRTLSFTGSTSDLYRDTTCKFHSRPSPDVWNRSPQQVVIATQGQKPAHYCKGQQPSRARISTISKTLSSDKRKLQPPSPAQSANRRKIWEDGYPQRAKPGLQNYDQKQHTHTHTHTRTPRTHRNSILQLHCIYTENCKPSGIPNAQEQIVIVK